MSVLHLLVQDLLCCLALHQQPILDLHQTRQLSRSTRLQIAAQQFLGDGCFDAMTQVKHVPCEMLAEVEAAEQLADLFPDVHQLDAAVPKLPSGRAIPGRLPHKKSVMLGCGWAGEPAGLPDSALM